MDKIALSVYQIIYFITALSNPKIQQDRIQPIIARTTAVRMHTRLIYIFVKQIHPQNQVALKILAEN